MNRQRGSRSRGLTPTITMRDSSWWRTASETTLGSNWPKEIRHFCAIGRSWLGSPSNSDEKSCGSTRNRSLSAGLQAGAHSSESRAIVASAEEVISDFQLVSKYLIRNRRTSEDNN